MVNGIEMDILHFCSECLNVKGSSFVEYGFENDERHFGRYTDGFDHPCRIYFVS